MIDIFDDFDDSDDSDNSEASDDPDDPDDSDDSDDFNDSDDSDISDDSHPIYLDRFQATFQSWFSLILETQLAILESSGLLYPRTLVTMGKSVPGENIYNSYIYG